MTDLTQHWRSAFDNKYLGAWNLWRDGKYVTATVTIDRIVDEQVTMQGGRKEQATLLYFRGKRTPLILTKKMGKMIAAAHGPMRKDWLGKAITLYVERGFKTKDGPADVLRVRNERAGAQLRDELESAQTPAEVERFDDDAAVAGEREAGVD